MKQFIYKGAVVKNSGSITAMVAYTGKDSKIMLNSGNYHFKMSRMEKIINKCILFNLGIVFVMDFILLIENHFFNKDKYETLGYIFPDGRPN